MPSRGARIRRSGRGIPGSTAAIVARAGRTLRNCIANDGPSTTAQVVRRHLIERSCVRARPRGSHIGTLDALLAVVRSGPVRHSLDRAKEEEV